MIIKISSTCASKNIAFYCYNLPDNFEILDKEYNINIEINQRLISANIIDLDNNNITYCIRPTNTSKDGIFRREHYKSNNVTIYKNSNKLFNITNVSIESTCITNTNGAQELILRHANSFDGDFSPNVRSTFLENELNPNANTYTIIGNLNENDYKFSNNYWKFKLIYYYDLVRWPDYPTEKDEIIWVQYYWITNTINLTQYELKPSVIISTTEDDFYSCINGERFMGLGLSLNVDAFLDGDSIVSDNYWNSAGIIRYAYDLIGWNHKLGYRCELYVYSPPTLEPSRTPLIAGQTHSPTLSPSNTPTINPTFMPSKQPTIITNSPTNIPSIFPTYTPTINPSLVPTVLTNEPTNNPSNSPTSNPTIFTNEPTLASNQPSQLPTNAPSTEPTTEPTKDPSRAPLKFGETFKPSNTPTKYPSFSPTIVPSDEPTIFTIEPSQTPTDTPLLGPTISPTVSPTIEPTSFTIDPTRSPLKFGDTFTPSNTPTKSPSFTPTIAPTNEPTILTILPSRTPLEMNQTYSPTISPSKIPSTFPTYSPTNQPTNTPLLNPTISPTLSTVYPTIQTDSPSESPSDYPSLSPSNIPSKQPTIVTNQPSRSPLKQNQTFSPSNIPSDTPTNTPTNNPSVTPTVFTIEPTRTPLISGQTHSPTEHPLITPSNTPSSIPSENPTNAPSFTPTIVTDIPTRSPLKGGESFSPSETPTDGSEMPSKTPTVNPTKVPTLLPTNIPTTPTPDPSLYPTNKPSKYPTNPTPLPIEGITPKPTEYIDVDFSWKTRKYSDCNTFDKAKANYECYVNEGASMSRIQLRNTFRIYGNNIFGLKRRLQGNTETNVKWILIDYSNNMRYILNDYTDVLIINNKFIDRNGVIIVESKLIINSLYSKYNGYCIDNDRLNEWIMKLNQVYGFQLEILGNNNNNDIISLKSDTIYLKTRPIPQNGYCNIITDNNAGLLDDQLVNMLVM